jgi:hypothetical protein
LRFCEIFSRDDQEVGHVSLEFKSKVYTVDINLGVIRIHKWYLKPQNG